VVWAGAGMYENPDLNVFLSKDYGLTFKKVNLFREQELGYLTSIATHPVDTGTAYLLFSIDHKAKILRTTDFGENWEDITRFGVGDSSQNGFPDIIVYSLLVFPMNTNIIWAGTEIGIFESLDNGATWHYANNGFPAVSVWQMFIQDNMIVIATHGRGIWTTSQRPDAISEKQPDMLTGYTIYPNPSKGRFIIELPLPSEYPADIFVTNLPGKIIYKDFLSYNGNTCRELDLMHLSQGTYIITISAVNSIFSSKIVIKK